MADRGIKVVILGASLLTLCALSFYSGYIKAINDLSTSIAERRSDFVACINDANSIPTELQQVIDSRVEEELLRHLPEANRNKATVDGGLFPKTVNQFAAGALRVSRDELLLAYDFGVPMKAADDQDAVILYNHARAFPSDKQLQREAVHGSDGESISKTSTSQALEHCEALNLIYLPIGSNTRPPMNECYVIIGDFESYHINRWMRMPDFATTPRKERQFDSTLPLRHVGRITMPKGIDELDVPDLWDNFEKREKGFLFEHFEALRIFLENVDSVLEDLKQLLKERNVVRNNTVVVLTVNAGQSELLSNFICSAKSKGFDIGNILVFPTDEESKLLAEGLGVATYYDKKNLGALPKGEAKMYGDPIFAAMMFAKILCVAYVNMLGHDVLFQDVDIVWYRDPLEYFHDTSNKDLQNMDILFQHDGSSQPRYNPLSANSGFYYVRWNKKTQYLFTSFVYHGAVVRKTKSHQQVLVQLLLEHASLFGLNVKVFDKAETDMFPGGWHFHQHWDSIRDIIDGNSNAYILHFSWTENKVNKLLFMRQMNEWYVQEQCITNDVTKLVEGGVVTDGSLILSCCSKEPIFSCHYKDKPSKWPCKDSPKIDKKGKLFWK